MTGIDEMDYTRKLNSWFHRDKNEPIHVFKHWTPKGSLRIEPQYLAGVLCCSLMLNGRVIGSFPNPMIASSDLSSGRLDDELGFSAKEAGIPELPEWNDLK